MLKKNSDRVCNWITATAGTGKTSSIDNLIQKLLKSNVYPGSILCITFTRNAAAEMAERYMKTAVNQEVMPRFETIHGFANSLLPNKHKLLSATELNNFIQEAIELVLRGEKWQDLIETNWETWPDILGDLKTLILSSQAGSTDLLKHLLLTSDDESNISLSRETVAILYKYKQGQLVSRLLSNNILVYQSMVTKEGKLYARYVPENLLSVTEYPDAVAELNQVFRAIVHLVTRYSQNKNIEELIRINEFINRVREFYAFIKEQRGVIDFTDMILMGTRVLKESPEKSRGFQHLFVDEAQDINQDQWNLIYELALDIMQTAGSSITIVGDMNQIIYEFNGASVSLYQETKERFQKAVGYLGGTWHETVLETNYRNAPVLLNFIGQMYPSDPVNPKGPKDGYVKTWLPLKENENTASNSEWKVPEAQILPAWIYLCVKEIKYLLNRCKLLNQNRYVEPKDIMILIPKRCINIFLLIEELKKNKVPISHSPFNIITDETTQEILAVAEIILDPTNDLLIAGILKGAYFRWTNEQLENLLISRDTTLLQHMTNSSDPELGKVLKVINGWFALPKDLYGLYSQILFHTEYGKTLWEEFPNETLIFWERVIDDKHLSIAEFVSNIKNSTHTISANINGVNITTIHSAKGQESEIVFLCNTHTYQAKNSSSNLIMDNLLLLKKNYKLYKIAKHKLLVAQDEELLRLLYVALTRAKEQIYILPPVSSDTINSKSWYASIMDKISLFQQTEDFYEIGTRPVGLTKQLKYS